MKRRMALFVLVTLLFSPLFSSSPINALPSQETNGGLGLAVMGEASGAYYIGCVNATIQGAFVIKNIGTILANGSISASQSEGPMGSLEVKTMTERFILYPQESIIISFVVTFLLNTTDRQSIDWLIEATGEDRTAEGMSMVSVAVVCRAFFQIYGRSGILTVEVKDQNNDDYNGLVVRIKRDYLTYANKSTRQGQATCLLSVPANYSLSIYREGDSVEVYQHKFEMFGDKRLSVLVERPSIERPVDYSGYFVVLVLGVAIGWGGKWISDRAHTRYRFRKAKIKLTPQEKDLWDWATGGLD